MIVLFLFRSKQTVIKIATLIDTLMYKSSSGNQTVISLLSTALIHGLPSRTFSAKYNEHTPSDLSGGRPAYNGKRSRYMAEKVDNLKKKQPVYMYCTCM